MEFTLTGDPDKVVAEERAKVEAELAGMISDLEKETAAAISLENSKTAKIAQMEKRLTIQEKHDAAIMKAEAVLRTCRIRSHGSQSKLAVLESELADTKVSKKRLKKLRMDIQKKSTEVTSHLEMLSSVVQGMMSIRSLVDVDSPILHIPGKMVWTTAPVYVFDKDGSVLPTNFGKFKITLSKDTGSLYVNMKPITPVVRNGSLCHPHVRTDGSPCLGNASNQLLVALRENDLQGAVMLVHNYLTHYNILDPWTSIAWWEPDCLWHMPQCECGITQANNCNCDKCVSCGAVFESSGGSAESSIRGCASCPTCCHDKHAYFEPDNPANIQGSTCQHVYCH